ncbi:hypothetical protein NC651_036260 [Populus alba x Populus x berolinensis]|nr:hypothetical protein NC651_036260 [Populus alba x Populus x berolinensis]
MSYHRLEAWYFAASETDSISENTFTEHLRRTPFVKKGRRRPLMLLAHGTIHAPGIIMSALYKRGKEDLDLLLKSKVPFLP